METYSKKYIIVFSLYKYKRKKQPTKIGLQKKKKDIKIYLQIFFYLRIS